MGIRGRPKKVIQEEKIEPFVPEYSKKTESEQEVDLMVATQLIKMQLADIRKARHITQKDLAEISGLSEGCISGIENGTDASPTLRSIIKYVNSLDAEIYIKFKPTNK